MTSFPENLTHPSGRLVVRDTTRAMLAFDPPGRPAGFDKALAASGLVVEGVGADETKSATVNHSGRFCFVQSRDGKPIDGASLDRLLAALGKKAGKAVRLEWVGPVYRFADDPGAQALMGVRRDAARVGARRIDGPKAEQLLTKLLQRAGLKANPKRSKFLSSGLYCEPIDLGSRDALAAAAMLLENAKEHVTSAHADFVPLMSPAAAVPSSETHWGLQWNMPRIGAPAAWDLGIGDPTVYVCVVDSGIERGHEELNRSTSWGYDSGTLAENSGAISGSVADITKPTGTTANDAHGTAIASIAVGEWDSGGVAGLAGGASLFALSAPSWSSIELETAIIRATAAGAPSTPAKRVLLIGGTSPVLDTPGTRGAIDGALGAGMLVVCPSGNADSATIPYPGNGVHPGVVVCGSTNKTDARYLSNYGPNLSVVAPGIEIPVADLTGAGGYGSGSYHLTLEGSSCGAAHVAGLGALLASAASLNFTSYPPAAGLLGAKIRNVIERTAEKIGTGYDSAINPKHPELGFGLIRADRALDFADVMIADDPLDSGVEPSTGVFWRDSAVVIRRDTETQPVVQASFDTWHANPPDSTVIYSKADGTACYAYVRVKNLGPATARNVRVRAVGAACSTGFMYPTDWNAPEDATHFVMTPLPWSGDPAAAGDEYVVGTLTAGQSKIVRFEISKVKADKALAWPGSHACGLAKVTADNDYAFNQFSPAVPVGGEQARRNNLCQRNLHVVTAASPWFFPFFAGNASDLDDALEIVIEARKLPAGAVMRLGLDEPERVAPKMTLPAPAPAQAAAASGGCGTRLTLLDGARFAVSCGGTTGIATLAPGSSFECGSARRDAVHVDGGVLVMADGQRSIEIRGKSAKAKLPKTPGALLPLYLEIPVPPGTAKTDRFFVDIVQKNRAGEIVGGLSLFLVP